MAGKVEKNLQHRFAEPITAGRRTIVTLHDAAKLFQEQPAKVQKEKPWATVFEHIARAGHCGGLWIDLCEIALRIAVNGPREQVFDPNAKMTHWGGRRKTVNERVSASKMSFGTA